MALMRVSENLNLFTAKCHEKNNMRCQGALLFFSWPMAKHEHTFERWDDCGHALANKMISSLNLVSVGGP